MSPLRGIKVVEATTMITGPLAGMLLADLGADVVKLENPNGGDPFRTFRGKVAQALAGASSLFFHGNPMITGPSLSDNLTGMYACYGILAALVERGRTGRGRVVDVNMLEATMAYMPDPFLAHTMLGLPAEPLMRSRASQSYALRCSDGKLVSIHMSSQEKFWLAVLDAFGAQKLASDPRFNSRAGRVDNYLELAQELQTIAATAPRNHWMERLEANDVPHAPVNSLPEVMADPQVRHLGSFHEMHHPERGAYQAIRRPVYFDGSRDDQPLDLPPNLNADGERIMRDLGYDDSEVEKWRRHNEKLVSGK